MPLSKYATHIEPNLEVIAGWIKCGHTEESIAARLGVGISTWKRHKSTEQKLRDCVNLSQQQANALVVNSLYKRAIGYDLEEQHVELIETGRKDSKGKPIIRRRIKKIPRHVPGNVGAQLAWLFNRMSDKWRDKLRIEHSGEIGHSGVLLTEKPIESTHEWEKYVQQLKNEADEGKPERDSDRKQPTSSGRLSPAASRLS